MANRASHSPSLHASTGHLSIRAVTLLSYRRPLIYDHARQPSPQPCRQRRDRSSVSPSAIQPGVPQSRGSSSIHPRPCSYHSRSSSHISTAHSRALPLYFRSQGLIACWSPRYHRSHTSYSAFCLNRFISTQRNSRQRRRREVRVHALPWRACAQGG